MCAVKLTLKFGGKEFEEMEEEGWRMVCGEVIAAQETGNSLPPTDFVDHVIKVQT